MKRKIYDSMRKWEEENGRTALLIDGARRVGKSYIAQEFTKREYKRYILIDFNHAPAEITDLFVHYLNDFRVKRDILELYRADIIKHAEGYQMKVAQIFDDIPAQLQKHDTKFKFSSLKKEARFREYEDALFWLSDAMITNICYNSTAPNIGLKPIEVKSSKNYTLTSLRKFKGKYKDQLHIPYVLHPNDLKEEDGILFLPLYMTPLI